MTLSVLVPNTVTEAMLISSTVAEDDHPAWSSATTYADGDRVVYDHMIYESTAGANINHNPATDMTDPPFWVAVMATNRWACLDDVGLTATVGMQSMTYVIKPGRIDALALVGLRASSVYIKMESAVDGVIYEQTHAILDQTRESNWYNYFFAPIVRDSLFEVNGLPVFGDAEITITVAAAGAVSLGNLLLGRRYEVASVKYGARVGVIDYSRKETNEFGVTSFVRRGYAKRADLQLTLTPAQVDAVQTLLADECRAKPCLWRGTAGVYQSLDLYAAYKDFSIIIEGPHHSVCSLELEGLL